MKRSPGKLVTFTLPLALLSTLAANLSFADDLAQVTVTATRPVKEIVGKTTVGGDIELISMSGTVKYTDLDITTHIGTTALENRVRAAAKAECEELDKHYPLTTPDAERCTKEAVRNAMPGMHAAIAAAEKRARK